MAYVHAHRLLFCLYSAPFAYALALCVLTPFYLPQFFESAVRLSIPLNPLGDILSTGVCMQISQLGGECCCADNMDTLGHSRLPFMIYQVRWTKVELTLHSD